MRYAASTAPEIPLYKNPFLTKSPGVKASTIFATALPGEYLAELTASRVS
jgi:hypothetical protein